MRAVQLSSYLLLGGTALIMIGLLMIFLGTIISTLAQKSEAKGEWAVVGFLGPFPLGFGSDRRLVLVALAIALIMFLAWLFLYRKS